ncbi:MAG: hypothetical protein AAFW64_00100 [Pseudomonadota bacterium]
MVELSVTKNGVVELVYVLKDAGEAAEYIEFLSAFWADAQFLLQPVRH